MSPSRRRSDADTLDHLKQLGDRIGEIRRSQRMTQEQLADAAGLHRTIVGFIEQGRRDVGVSTLWLVADALDVPVRDLFPEGAEESARKV